MYREWNCLQYGNIVTLHVCTGNGTVCSTVSSQRSSARNRKSERGIDYQNITLLGIWYVFCAQKYNTFQTAHQEWVLCRETEHVAEDTTDMYTVCRYITTSRRYIRNVYCAQIKNTFMTVKQKRVQRTEIQHFPGGKSEMCTLHRKRTISRR